MRAVSPPITVAAVGRAAEIATVAQLARDIWYEHYEPIIGREQIDYMVPRFQSEAAIARQQAQGLRYYLLLAEGTAIGYFAVEPQPDAASMLLSKLYVLKAWRHRNAARRALDFIEAECRRQSLSRLWLTVNRFNPAVQAYERLGFRNVVDVVTDIGAGFVMDDYRMEKRITLFEGPAKLRG